MESSSVEETKTTRRRKPTQASVEKVDRHADPAAVETTADGVLDQVSTEEYNNMFQTMVKATAHHVAETFAGKEIRRLVREEIHGSGLKRMHLTVNYDVGDHQEVQKRTASRHFHDRFKDVMEMVAIGETPYLVGPSGSGKGVIADQVARLFGLKMYTVRFFAGMSEINLSGMLIPVEANGSFSYVPVGAVLAFEHGGLFFADEVDNGDNNTTLILNPLTNGEDIHIPIRFRNPVVKRHPNFRMIMAGNTTGHGADRVYTGRQALDGAFMDRIRSSVVRVDYDKDLEAALGDDEVVDWAWKVRDAISKHNLRHIMSTRTIVRFTRQKRMLGWGRDRWYASYFDDWTRDELTLLRGMHKGSCPSAQAE
jgi:hypothetical protein